MHDEKPSHIAYEPAGGYRQLYLAIDLIAWSLSLHHMKYGLWIQLLEYYQDV
jgi:hypothetical protein